MRHLLAAYQSRCTSIAEHDGPHLLAPGDDPVGGFRPIAFPLDVCITGPYMQEASGIRAEDRTAFDHPDLSRRSESGRRPTDGDASDEPRVHLAVHPSHGTNSDLDTPRKPKIRLQLIDH
jgi:hypothetical protein